MGIQNAFEEYFCLHSNLSDDDIWILEASDKMAWKMTSFGLTWGQNLMNWVAHPYQEFPGVPPLGFLDACTYHDK